MALQNDQQYAEEISLIVECGLKGQGVELRGDRPSYQLWLTETREAKAQLTAQLESVSMRERTLLAELLPDDERKRLAQLARDIRDDNLPDLDDTPVTPCPEWCEAPEHNGDGKYHEGAILEFHADGRSGERVILSVMLDDAGKPSINVQCGADLSVEENLRLITGLIRASTLASKIEDAR